MNYSNPRTELTVTDWPYGRKQVTAIFQVEAGKRGERVTRTTQNLKGGWNKPKKLTYSLKQRIVDGSDGKTYIAELTMYGNISIMQSNMKYSKESFFSDSPQYQEMLALFD